MTASLFASNWKTGKAPTILIWVPGRRSVPDNEVAYDREKSAATTTDKPPRPISFATAIALIRCTITNLSNNTTRTTMVYENFSWKADCIGTSNRADVGLLPYLQSGHAPLL